jgi:TetR/AcrR family transcriptional regulator, regulator of biofilm formation and stress response
MKVNTSRGRDGSETERLILAATLRIIGRSGMDRVTHRAIAAEAGLSLGSVTHHFGSRDELISAALQSAVTREVSRLKSLAFSLQNKAFDLGQWLEALASWYAEEARANSDTHIACYEAFLAAARTGRHRDVMRELVDTWRQSAELALTAAGSPSPGLHADILVTTLLGMLLRQLAIPDGKFKQRTVASLYELATGLTGGHRAAAGRRAN